MNENKTKTKISTNTSYDASLTTTGPGSRTKKLLQNATHTKYFLSFANHCKIDRDNSLLRIIAPRGEINDIANWNKFAPKMDYRS